MSLSLMRSAIAIACLLRTVTKAQQLETMTDVDVVGVNGR